MGGFSKHKVALKVEGKRDRISVKLYLDAVHFGLKFGFVTLYFGENISPPVTILKMINESTVCVRRYRTVSLLWI